jgi:hypothetical protein
MWQKSFGGSLFDRAYSIQQTTDGGYIVAGESGSTDGDVTGNHGSADGWVVKLDSSGKIIWQKSLGGSSIDFSNSIQQTTDGGYIVAGYSFSNSENVTGNHGDFDSWVVKLNSSGNITWQKSLGGSNRDEAKSIQQTTDGGYIVAGYSYSINGDVTGNHGGFDSWVVKLNSSGNITWQKSLGGSENDEATSIQQTTDGGYIVAGYAWSNDGDITGNHSSRDYWVVKLSSVHTGIDVLEEKTGISFFPNPANSKLSIVISEQTEIEISNIEGQIIKRLKPDDNRTDIDISDFSSGVYVIRALTNTGITTKLFIKE